MNATKLLICTVVSTVYVFALDYLFYGILMTDFFSDCCMNEMPNMLFLILGMAIFSLVFCLMYPKGVEGTNKTQQGLRYGIMVAFLVFVSGGFIWYSLFPTETCGELSEYLVDMIFRIVQIGLLGIIVAHISGVTYSGSRGKGDILPPPPPDDSGSGPSGSGG